MNQNIKKPGFSPIENEDVMFQFWLATKNRKVGKRLYRNTSEAVIDMHERGFVEDFELSTGNVLWVQRKIFLKEDEFSVIESHRFNLVAEQGAFVTVHGLATSCSCVKGILIVQSFGETN